MIGRDGFLGDTSLDVDGLALFLRLVGGDGQCLVHADLLGLVLAMLLSDLLMDLPWNCGAFSSRNHLAYKDWALLTYCIETACFIF